MQRCRYDSYSGPPPTLSRLPCSVRSKRFCSLLLHRFATMFWSFAIAGRLLFGGDLDQFSGAPARLLSSAWKKHTSSHTRCIQNESCLTHAWRSLFLLSPQGIERCIRYSPCCHQSQMKEPTKMPTILTQAQQSCTSGRFTS